MRALDIHDRDQLKEVLQGAVQIYHCVNVPYSKWAKELPAITGNILSVIEELGIPLLITDNLYMYPEDASEPLSEDMSWASTGKKGKIRAMIAKTYMDAHNTGRIKMAIVRAPDFFGPRVGMNSYYSERIFGEALKGKNPSVMGNPDMLHQIAFTPDLARASIMVAEDPEAYGQVWHLPSDTAITQREFVQKVYQRVGMEAKVGSIGKMMIRIGGLFNREIREVGEMMYEFNKPYLVSHKKFMGRYDFKITPLDDAIDQTMEWFRQIA